MTTYRWGGILAYYAWHSGTKSAELLLRPPCHHCHQCHRSRNAIRVQGCNKCASRLGMCATPVLDPTSLSKVTILHQSDAPGESGAASPLSNFNWHLDLFASGESGERGATLQLPSRGTFLHQSYHLDQVLLVNQLPHYHIPTIMSLICHITLIVSCCNFFAFDQLSSFFSSCTVYIVQ